MSRCWRGVALIAVTLLISANACKADQISSPSGRRARISMDGQFIIYDNESVRLTRAYSSYEDYDDDPNNIDPSENAHVELLMTRAVLPQRFASRAEAFATIGGLTFPGYGSWNLETKQSSAAEFGVRAFEIPRANKTRYVAVAEGPKGWTIIDDFVVSDQPKLRAAERGDGWITYRDTPYRKALVHRESSDGQAKSIGKSQNRECPQWVESGHSGTPR